jgi:hypothetical protein
MLVFPLLLALVVAGCGGEDRPGSVDVIDDGSAASASHAASGSASGVGVYGPGVVAEKPDGAEQLDVTLDTWEVTLGADSIAAGSVYIVAENVSEETPHELVLLRTDLEIDALPLDDRGAVSLRGSGYFGEVAGFSAGSQAARAFDLEPGRYILVCNILSEVDGADTSHFQQGMAAVLTVE